MERSVIAIGNSPSSQRARAGPERRRQDETVERRARNPAHERERETICGCEAGRIKMWEGERAGAAKLAHYLHPCRRTDSDGGARVQGRRLREGMEGWREGEETNTNANGQEFRLEIKGDPAARRTPIHSRASLKTEGLHWVSAISVHVVPQPCDMLCRCVGWVYRT